MHNSQILDSPSIFADLFSVSQNHSNVFAMKNLRNFSETRRRHINIWKWPSIAASTRVFLFLHFTSKLDISSLNVDVSRSCCILYLCDSFAWGRSLSVQRVYMKANVSSKVRVESFSFTKACRTFPPLSLFSWNLLMSWLLSLVEHASGLYIGILISGSVIFLTISNGFFFRTCHLLYYNVSVPF